MAAKNLQTLEIDSQETSFATIQPFWMFIKTFRNHPKAEMDTETDADHKRLFFTRVEAEYLNKIHDWL